MTADFAGSGGLAEAVAVGATGSVEVAGSQEVAAAAEAQPPSSLVLVVSQALDSSVGTDRGWCSLTRAPLVGATATVDRPRVAPRPPRSVARPRPRAASGRPPRAIRLLDVGTSAPVVVVNVSLALALDRSFFWLETSPHCEMVPAKKKKKHGSVSGRSVEGKRRGMGQRLKGGQGRVAHHQECGQWRQRRHHQSP